MQTAFKNILTKQVDAAGELYRKAEGWQLEDSIMQDLKKEDPTILKKSITRVKILTVNTYYQAGVKQIHIEEVAKHIIDTMPQKASLSKAGFVKRLVQGFPAEYQALASKFAHFFIDEDFPIYDTYARETIILHVGKESWKKAKGRGKTKKTEYEVFYNYFQNLKERLNQNIQDPYSTKQIDCYLWLTGLYKEWKSKGSINNKEIEALFCDLTLNGIPQSPLSELLP